jgi:hypothetical protein
LSLFGCRDDSTSNQSRMATVGIVYQAPTALDQDIADRFPACVRGVGQTHVHLSWRGFDFVNLNAVGADRWEVSFSDVPVDEVLSIRVNDPNGCESFPTGAVTTNIFANGVRLTTVVDTPGNGTEPGLSFRVNSSGTVTP